MKARDLAVWTLFIAVEATLQVAFKIGGAGLVDDHGLCALVRSAVTSLWVWLGVSLYLVSFVLWMGILDTSDVGKAFPMSAMVYVATVGVGAVLFHEPLDGLRLLAVALIIGGVVLVAGEPDGPSAPSDPGTGEARKDRLEIRLHERIDQVPRLAWDALSGDPTEGHAYLRAVERAGIPGFASFYVTVWREERLLAAAPGFVTDYALETTLAGPMADMIRRLRLWWPRLLLCRLAGLGSPVTEAGSPGMASDVSPEVRLRLIGALAEGLARQAQIAGARLTAVKDLPASDRTTLAGLHRAGLRAMPSLPCAIIALEDLPDEAAYLARLTRSTRRDLRRKMRGAETVVIDRVTDLTPLRDEIDALYAETRSRAKLAFEVLDHRYFEAVLAELGDRAALFTYRLEGRMIGFNLLVRNRDQLVDKYFCASAQARKANLYFISWLHNLNHARSLGVRQLVVGQGGYGPKLRLGCQLSPTLILFRHSWPPANLGLRLAARLFRMADSHPARPPSRAPVLVRRRNIPILFRTQAPSGSPR